MKALKAKRLLIKWERYHARFPQSGKWYAGPHRLHEGHVSAHARWQFAGRSAPRGIRPGFYVEWGMRA